ncbi:MAG: GC-type dockerin domain-anchored protein, partial [Planctomycetota bacterium]
YFFDWIDLSGSFTSSDDPTFELVAGQTYTFQRASTSHPFAICDDTLPVAGSDGAFQRTTFSSAVINAATLQPIADFTADPAPTTDLITWTPTAADIGVYYYTCTITGHPAMTGRIEIIEGSAEPCLADTNGNGVADPGDFNAWVLAFNTNAPECDQNGDSVCDPSDFNAWILNFNAGC